MIAELDDMYINMYNDRMAQAQAHFALLKPKIREYHSAEIYQFCLYINEEEEKSLLAEIADDCLKS